MARGPLSRVIDRGGQPGNSWRFRAFAAIPTRLPPTATHNYVLRAVYGSRQLSNIVEGGIVGACASPSAADSWIHLSTALCITGRRPRPLAYGLLPDDNGPRHAKTNAGGRLRQMILRCTELKYACRSCARWNFLTRPFFICKRWKY